MRAPDGSVRDGLSLLDQAIALSGQKIEAAAVVEMLGLADRARIGDLFEAVMAGRIGEALALFGEMDALGVDPHLLLQDLLELVHLLTRRKLSDAATEGLTEAETERVSRLAEALALAELTRAWQILLKGVSEAQIAPRPRQAVEMVLVRLAHASRMPTPGDLVRRLTREESAQTPQISPQAPARSGHSRRRRRAGPRIESAFPRNRRPRSPSLRTHGSPTQPNPVRRRRTGRPRALPARKI